MQCHEFEQLLEQQQAALLPADAAAHLQLCGQCRAMVADLEAIQAAARHLAVEEVAPPERLWLALRAQLKSEGLIREEAAADPNSGWLAGWLAAFPRPALAGAYVIFLVAAALVVVRGHLPRMQPGGDVSAPPAATTLTAQLATMETRTVRAMRPQDPVVNASLRKNLDIVDNSIAVCEKSVREEPQNELARDYLYGAYQQKAELLALMMEHGASGD